MLLIGGSGKDRQDWSLVTNGEVKNLFRTEKTNVFLRKENGDIQERCSTGQYLYSGV